MSQKDKERLQAKIRSDVSDIIGPNHETATSRTKVANGTKPHLLLQESTSFSTEKFLMGVNLGAM
jgi:hypothetical protein